MVFMPLFPQRWGLVICVALASNQVSSYTSGMMFYMEYIHLGVNQISIFIVGTHGILSYIYYHYNGVLLTYANTLIHRRAKTFDIPPYESMVATPKASD